MDNKAFREADIRPRHLLDDQARRLAADIAWLTAQKDNFVLVACPACGEKEADRVFEKYQMTFVRCLRCETVYINPRPTPAILEHYYRRSENYAYWNTHIFPASEDVRRERIFRPRVHRVIDICKKYDVAPNAFLEVGAGFGTFCEEMMRQNFFKEVLAVEPTPELAQTCRKKGLNVIEKPIEHVRLDDIRISAAASFEVIEHLFNPREFLVNCGNALPLGGILILTCPNVKGFDILVMKDIADAVDNEHLNYFHPDSMELLLTRCGYDVLELSTPGKLDADIVRNKVMDGKFDLEGQPFLEELLIRKWDECGSRFQQFLIDSGMSSHMWVVAQKMHKGKF